jgi:hypothetical protein
VRSKNSPSTVIKPPGLPFHPDEFDPLPEIRVSVPQFSVFFIVNPAARVPPRKFISVLYSVVDGTLNCGFSVIGCAVSEALTTYQLYNLP